MNTAGYILAGILGGGIGVINLYAVAKVMQEEIARKQAEKKAR